MSRVRQTLRVFALLIAISAGALIGQTGIASEAPVADAGPSRYVGPGPVRLDGTRSCDPDGSGVLSFAWRQLSGPSVTMTDANSATPLVSGPSQTDNRGRTISGPFVQTEVVQECEFELVVSDGQLTSLPDTVKIVIVPFYGADTLRLENASFDPNKPTFIYFGGGDCVNGFAGQVWGGLDWAQRANLIGFPGGYTPDGGAGVRTYYKYGDMIIVYLSSVAPDYRQPIQTSGWSTGGQPAIDVGLRLNLTYRDARYAVNRISFLDATPFCRSYSESIRSFLASSVDGEQCWIDNYVGQDNSFSLSNVLNVNSALSHAGVPNWYHASPTMSEANKFNHGIVAGAYWSVIGPGKNLQLAPTPDQTTYRFEWVGAADVGYMDLFDESFYPGRLPEPVTLGAWVSRSKVSGEVDGAVLSCHHCENAVGYQLLFGPDPYRVMDYTIISDTPTPPTEIRREYPAGQIWWTIRVRDQYGSTIYADPIRLDLTNLPPLSVENARTGKRYGLIGHAILEAESGDVIVLDPGTYDESIEFGDKTLVVRSLDPNNPEVVTGTIIRARGDNPAVTFSGPESGGCVLAGLTIQSDTVGISCRDAAPTIQNCVVESPDGIAIEFSIDHEPRLDDCTVLGRIREGGDPGLIAYWKLDEAEGAIASDSAGDNDGTVVGTPLWQPTAGKLGGALQFDGVACFVKTGFVCDPWAGPFSIFAWVMGGTPGQTIVSQAGGANWLMASAPDGALMTELKGSGRTAAPLLSNVEITDGAWHRVGLVWDGANRILYVDDIEVAKDTQTNLVSSAGGLYVGAGKGLAPGTFWSGLIDDIRVYDRAVEP